MSNQPCFWLATRPLSLLALLLGLTPQIVFAADCTYRENALGNTIYQCDDGKQGTLREDALGHVRGSNAKTGERVTWREDSLGNLRASDGTVCRTNALGQLKCRGESTPPALLEGK